MDLTRRQFFGSCTAVAAAPLIAKGLLTREYLYVHSIDVRKHWKQIFTLQAWELPLLEYYEIRSAHG
jgi:hypothetical protein